MKDASKKIYGNLSEAAKAGLNPAERSLTNVIDNYRPVEPFRELADLRTAISTAMRNEQRTFGRTPAYARLSQLRGGIEEALSGVVEQKATQEARAVAQGQLKPEQTITANLQRQIDAWRSERAEAGVGGGGGTGTVTAGGTVAVPGSSGAARQGGSGPANAAGDQGIPPAFDQAAQERLAQASAATLERVATYGKPSGPVGQVLRSAGQRGQYQVPAGAVGQKVFTPGPRGFENVQAYRQATSDPEALNTLQDYVASRLQRVASRPDGTLDPTKTANWLKAHSDAMRAFPDLAAKFQDAASATTAMEDMAALRKHALDSAQRSELAPLIGAKNDADVTKAIGGFLQSNDVRALANWNA